MSKRDRVLPILAGLSVLLVAILVVLLIRSASQNGIEALEEAKLAQVATTARSFNARVESSMSSTGGVRAQPWELTLGSQADKAALKTYARDPEAQSGSFLVDNEGKITNGVLLREGQLGTTYAPWSSIKTSLATQPAVVLPVSDSGSTTELPSYAFVVPIRGEDKYSVRGAFVFEQAVTSDSTFSQEIKALADEEAGTSAWRFIDSQGSVVATTLDNGLGQTVPDPRLLELKPGLSHLNDELAIIADVPAVGWRVAFTQDHDEFDKPLTGPLQNVGLLLALLLLAVGLTLTVALARRLQQSREQAERLRNLAAAQEEFISVVSHELRTPVAGILGFLQTSLDHWDDMSEEDRHTAVRRAFTNARRLQAMTRDVLDTESIESGRLGYVKHRIDLSDEIRTAIEAFAPAGPDTEVRADLPEGPVFVHADPDRLQQVLANLLDNARKNSPPGEAVVVSLVAEAETARFTVTDRGAGIDPGSVDRIFDKFVRGRSGDVTGTGLGLYISRRIVEAHDGRIWAESTPGEVTRFLVELPLAAAAPVESSRLG